MTQLTIPVSAEDHAQGDTSAAITLVEYGDYQCPYCGAAYPLVQQVQQQFGADLRFVFRNFPLTQAHPLALMAAELAEAAATLGQFWPMHDWIYENQQAWSEGGAGELSGGITAVGLDASKLDACPQAAADRPAHQGGLQRRSPQRREWHAELFHQWQVAPGIAAGACPGHRTTARALRFAVCVRRRRAAVCT